MNILVGAGEAIHVDTFDMYQAKARAHFIAAAAAELRLDADVLKHDAGQLGVLARVIAAEHAGADDAPPQRLSHSPLRTWARAYQVSALDATRPPG